MDILKRGKHYHQTYVPQSGEMAWYRNYKEPLTPLSSGYGYEGVLLYNITQDKIQCAFCGGWYKTLRTHLSKHGMTARSYKEEYGLKKTTALVGESMRVQMIQHGVEVAAQHAKNNVRWRGKKSKTHRKPSGKMATEQKNLLGYCETQLLTWMRQHPKATSQTAPEVSNQIRKTFGSWAEGRRCANLPVYRHDGITKAMALEGIRHFVQTHHRVPYQSDGKRGLLPCSCTVYRRLFGSLAEASRQVGLTPRAKHTGGLQYDEATVEAWRVLRQKGMSIKDISRQYRCHEQTVAYRIQGYGRVRRR